MPKDYKNHRTKQKKQLPGFLWLLMGLFIGLFVAFIVYIDKQPATDNSFSVAVNNELDNIKKKVDENKETSKENKKPKFNFYTILSEYEVLIPDTSYNEDSDLSSSDDAASNNKKFILQAGSFQNLQDAEKLKASLALLGLESNIQNVELNGDLWHRVRIGPFENTKKLHETMQLVKQNGISAISMELR